MSKSGYGVNEMSTQAVAGGGEAGGKGCASIATGLGIHMPQ